MRWWEYAGSAALMGGSLAIRFTVDVSGPPDWQRGILLDDVIYDETLVRSPRAYQAWRDVGDVLYLSSFAWAGADPLIAGLAYDWDAALQMAAMNLEAFSVYSMMLSVSQLVVQRERPVTRECDQAFGAQVGVSCGDGNANRNRSFIGGHVGTVTTTAVMTCMHHAYMPLWGSPQADALPCITWTAATAVTLASRTRTGQHNLSDNMLGMAAGVLAGMVPWSLHYAYRDAYPRNETSARGQRLFIPTAVGVAPLERGAQLTLSGLSL